MRITKITATSLVALLFMGCGFAAHASLIDNGNTTIGLSGGVPYMDVGHLSWDGNPAEYCGAGVFQLTVNNTRPINPQTGTIYTFCTDVGVNWKNDTYTAVQFLGQTGVNPKWGGPGDGTYADLAIQNASWLYNQVFELNPNAFLGASGQANGVAMQFAIWEALYDTQRDGKVNIDFSAGRFQYVDGFGNPVAQATTYLNLLNAARTSGFTTYTDTWLKPNDLASQGMLYNNLTPVPEPTTLIAGALLLLPFGASAARVLRRKA